MAAKTSLLPGDIGLIELGGALLSSQEIDELRKAVEHFLHKDTPRLLIDFSGVTYMNSSAMGVLVSAHTSFSRRGWHLKLCSLNNQVNVIFVVTKLNTVFSIFKTREEALESLGGGESR